MRLLLEAYSAYQQLVADAARSNTSPEAQIGVISDLYMTVGEKMCFRVPNGLHEFGEKITEQMFNDTFASVIDDFDKRLQIGNVEDAYDLGVTDTFTDHKGNIETADVTLRVRMTVYKHSRGVGRAAVVRFAPAGPIDLGELNLDPLARNLLNELRGAIVVTGPTHSGKTNTMVSMIDYINRNHKGHIVTCEDPIEIPITPVSCRVSQLEIGPDIPSYAAGVHGSLRKSPIAVMVGEIRESATAQAALRVAQGGHFLIAGLHGPDAVGALRAFCSFLDPSRLAEERAQLAQRLNGVIYQVLVRSTDGQRYWVACEVISFLKNPGLRIKLARGDFDSLESALIAGEEGTLSLNTSLCNLLLEEKITFADAKAATYGVPELTEMARKKNIVF